MHNLHTTVITERLNNDDKVSEYATATTLIDVLLACMLGIIRQWIEYRFMNVEYYHNSPIIADREAAVM